MSLNRPRDDGDQRPDTARNADAHSTEPGVGVDLPPPFVAPDEPTRWLFALNRFGFRPGLGRIEGLLRDLGHPEREMKTLVIAGTNGKGSTTRILAHLLQSAGHRVAAYTSPHLLSVHERIEVDGRPVAAAEFSRRVEAIRPLTEKHGASWFETLTALALDIARDAGVEWFCCETGLGGRLDASNALPAAATLLTTVGLDHQRILGETRTEIAAEKLGLLKSGTPLFTGVDDALRGQVFMAAVEAGSPCFFLDELARWPDDGADDAWDLVLRDRIFAGLPPVGTDAMRRNVGLALLALSELEKVRDASLLPADVPAALGNLFVPGRYQRWLEGPGWTFDTAHNAQALAVALGTFLRRPCNGRRVVVFGAMYDKGMDTEVAQLLARCDHVVGLPVSLPRSRTPSELATLFGEAGLDAQDQGDPLAERCTVWSDMGSGLAAVAAGLDPADEVLVTGSCFTVAEVLHRLGVDELARTREAAPAAPLLADLAAGRDPRRKDDP